MSNQSIFYLSIAVFTLMMIGIVLTVLEFKAMAARSPSGKRGDVEGA